MKPLYHTYSHSSHLYRYSVLVTNPRLSEVKAMIRTLMLALTVLFLIGCGSAQKKEWRPPIYTKAMMPVCPTGTIRMVDYTYGFFVSEKLAEFDQEVTVGCYELGPQNKYWKDGRLQLEDPAERDRWLVGPAITFQATSKRVFWERRITEKGTESIYYARPLHNHYFAIMMRHSCGGTKFDYQGVRYHLAYPCGKDTDFAKRNWRAEKALQLNRWPKSRW